MYVLALVGESPAVVTELLWVLLTQERRTIVGCELWTTTHGWGPGGTAGLAALGGSAFAELAALGTLPGWSRSCEPSGDPTAPPADATVRVFIPEVGGRRLDDICDPAEADVYSVALHRRVAHLKRALDVPLLGSLAGGRKTMTAALHSAFSLYARAGDRLCHVLLDRTVEGALRREQRLKDYLFPRAPIGGVAAEQQVSLVDVPFFPLSDYLAAGGARPARSLFQAARSHLEGLRAQATGRVEFRRRPRSAILTVGDGVGMAPKTAVAFAVLVQQREEILDSRLADLANDALVKRLGPAVTQGRLIAKDSLTRTLRNLVRGLEEAVGADPKLATLIPKVSARDAWRVDPDPTLDLSALAPAVVVSTLFPAETSRPPRRRRGRPRENDLI